MRQPTLRVTTFFYQFSFYADEGLKKIIGKNLIAKLKKFPWSLTLCATL